MNQIMEPIVDPRRGMYKYGLSQVTEEGVFERGSPAGTEIIPVFYGDGTGPLQLNDIHTISFSTHRELTQLRPLGMVSPAGFVQGKRTIAGTIIVQLRRGSEIRKILGDSYPYYNRMLHDELPPFNIVVIMPSMKDDGLVNPNVTPYVTVIFGIKIIDTASSVSIDDTVIEQQFSYIAMDMRDMTSSIDMRSYHPEDEEQSIHDNSLDDKLYADDEGNVRFK